MLKIDYISEESKGAEVGQVRESSDGRVVLVINNETTVGFDAWDDDEYPKHLKLLVLKKGRSNEAMEVFHTVPKDDFTAEEIAEKYPTVISAELVIKGTKL